MGRVYFTKASGGEVREAIVFPDTPLPVLPGVGEYYLEVAIADQVVWTDSAESVQDGPWTTFFEFDNLHPEGEEMAGSDFEIRVSVLKRGASGGEDDDVVVDTGCFSLWALLGVSVGKYDSLTHVHTAPICVLVDLPRVGIRFDIGMALFDAA